jgi:hypothetical protein
VSVSPRLKRRDHVWCAAGVENESLDVVCAVDREAQSVRFRLQSGRSVASLVFYAMSKRKSSLWRLFKDRRENLLKDGSRACAVWGPDFLDLLKLEVLGKWGCALCLMVSI